MLKHVGKASLALVTLVGLALAWAIFAATTATPSFDPTVHPEAVEIAQLQQPDPEGTTRYPELVDALANFQAAMAGIVKEIVPPDGSPDEQWVSFENVLTTYSKDTIGYGFKERSIANAEAAVDFVLERQLFAPVEDLLSAPNLSNPYVNWQDTNGEPLRIRDWNDRLYFQAREYASTVAGCAKILADRNRIDDATDLILRNKTLPDVFLRQSTSTEHHVGGHATAEILARAIELLLVHPNLDEEALAQLRSAQDRLSEFKPYVHVVNCVRLAIRDDVYRSHTASGHYIASVGFELTSPRLYKRSGVQNFVEDVHGRYFHARRDSSVRLLYSVLAPFAETGSQTDVEGQRATLARVQTNFDIVTNRFRVVKNVRNRFLSRIRDETEHRARITALGILLAMAEHRLDTGDWPTALDELVPDYLDTVPVNPLTGDPFEYEHEPGEPPSLECLGMKRRVID